MPNRLSLLLASFLMVVTGSAVMAKDPVIPPNAWTPLRVTGDGPIYSGLPGRRGWIQVAYDPASKTVIMFGGDADTYRSDLWQYDFVRNRWHQVRAHPDPQGPCRRDMHNFVYDPVGKRFWMWNGSVAASSEGPNAQPGCGQFTNNQDQWTYDPAANTWTRQGQNPDRMLASGAAYDPVSRTMVQFGGDRALSSNSTDWTLLMDVATGQWTKLSNLEPSPPPSVNLQGAFVYMPNAKKFLLFGGRNGSGTTAAHGQTWLFDPARRKWEQLSLPTSPPARDLHSMVFDEVNGVVILHGGRPPDRQSAFADTWIFDPLKGTWTEITPLLSAPGPPMRYGTGVYDPVNKVMIMVPGEWGYDTYAFRYRPDALGPRAPSSPPPSKSR